MFRACISYKNVDFAMVECGAFEMVETPEAFDALDGIILVVDCQNRDRDAVSQINEFVERFNKNREKYKKRFALLIVGNKQGREMFSSFCFSFSSKTCQWRCAIQKLLKNWDSTYY